MAKRGTDNSNVSLKLAVRRWVSERIARPWRVLDLYCGEVGAMYQGIWREAETYFGVDKFRPHKLATTARMSAEVASQRLDLGRYNIFDVDCYASPWAVARRVLLRRGPGRLALVLTDGEDRALKKQGNEIIRATLGLGNLSDLRLLVRYRELVMGLMVRSLAEMPAVRFLGGVKAETNTHVTYLGLLFDKQEEEPCKRHSSDCSRSQP